MEKERSTMMLMEELFSAAESPRGTSSQQRAECRDSCSVRTRSHLRIALERNYEKERSPLQRRQLQQYSS
jgi:hypothetical protein